MTQPAAIVFSDWDGTITLQDSNDYLTDNIGFGVERRKELNRLVLEGKMSFRDSFDEMLRSVDMPFEECIQLLKDNVKLDPGFAEFYKWTSENNVKVIVVSSGMKPIIRALLTELVGEEAVQNIEIVSNDVKYLDPEGKKWEIVFHDDSHFGHDKSLCIKPYQVDGHPPLFYCGDGVSDLSAAKETDLLFAKAGRDLITWCEREHIPYRVFDSFKDIHQCVQSVVEGTTAINDLIQNKF
ncbi:hypothetical protein CANCADRAFT_148254 [Tortispora caseinolytica NRRL Y-17796]|uniref:Phosphatase n=1 Tax=Tortispora caseinolytica NRRL Y-17796 TaxID=767744 RepID=A0A1E4TI52_9ASCO|nr:hypothetical protein CANCADRAFT_148254 [Tortispora caseinolytica NRRL Y-17796]